MRRQQASCAQFALSWVFAQSSLRGCAAKPLKNPFFCHVRSRMTLLRGDAVWEQFLEETERLLSLRQYAVAVIALMETSLHLQGLHLPWLALLRRPS